MISAQLAKQPKGKIFKSFDQQPGHRSFIRSKRFAHARCSTIPEHCTVVERVRDASFFKYKTVTHRLPRARVHERKFF